MNPRICISGIGVVSPIGTGKENYWSALQSGRNGIRPIDVFDCSGIKSRSGAQVDGFDAAALIGNKGLKYTDRPSRFAVAASALAIQDAGLSLTEHDPAKRGIVLGTAFGGLTSLKEFNRERVLEGAKWVSPLKFPNTPINASSYQIPIRYGMRFINVTIPNGIPSTMEAIRYCTFLLHRTPDAVLLCGGVDELSYWAYHCSYFLNQLAGISGEEISCPFDKRRNGYVLGEGSALLVLESLSALRDRNGKVLAEIAGSSNNFCPLQSDNDLKVAACSETIGSAIRNAGISPDEIGLIIAAANSVTEIDKMEANAILKVFGKKDVPVTAIKSMIGETFAPSGALQIAAAIMSLQTGIIPPTINLETPEFPLNVITELVHRDDIRYVLVNSIDLTGNSASVVLKHVD